MEYVWKCVLHLYHLYFALKSGRSRGVATPLWTSTFVLDILHTPPPPSPPYNCKMTEKKKTLLISAMNGQKVASIEEKR